MGERGGWWPFGRKSEAGDARDRVETASVPDASGPALDPRTRELEFVRQVETDGPLREVCARASRLMQDALAFYREGRQDAAIARYNGALEWLGPLAAQHPDIWDIRYNLIRCYEAVDPDRAIAIGFEARELLLRWGDDDRFGPDYTRAPHLFTVCRKLYKQLVVRGRALDAMASLQTVIDTSDAIYAQEPNAMLLVEKLCAMFFLDQIRAGHSVKDLLAQVPENGPEPSFSFHPGRSEAEDALIAQLQQVASALS
jgi:hypothetical protein